MQKYLLRFQHLLHTKLDLVLIIYGQIFYNALWHLEFGSQIFVDITVHI